MEGESVEYDGTTEGSAVVVREGTMDGTAEGDGVDDFEGKLVGKSDGIFVKWVMDGNTEGFSDSCSEIDGKVDGEGFDGEPLANEGTNEGAFVVVSDGAVEGSAEGETTGMFPSQAQGSSTNAGSTVAH
mmetsp:Transcript_1968/g.2758  ORF Transcript_1968/g.2758 Transcript_1968/m.2758 type:complete len:129 (-) Transcript_1968:256-642(-)